MEQILTLVLGKPKSQNYYLRTSLDEYNEERLNCGQIAYPYPKYPTEQENPEEVNAVAVYNLDNSPSTIILRNAGVRTRQGGLALEKEGLQRRIKAVWENKGKIEWFEPSPTGINRREWYLPMITEIVTGVLMVVGTILLSRILYIWAEHYHAKWDCVHYGNFYSIWCYSAKKSRAYLEDMNYNMVYTALIGCGAFASKLLMSYQKQLNKVFQ